MHDDNHGMSLSQNPLFESALSLPQSERADLAFQLLQSLTPPGEEISTEEFGKELRQRVAAHRRGELQSFSLEETRQVIQNRLSQERDQ
jgi:putative addiction module component (TIGR02574 family)